MYAPNHWMLKKLTGKYASRPRSGPHKRRESVPLCVFLREGRKYALTMQETIKICKDKEGLIKVDNKVRRDHKFPTGLQDVISIEKTGEFFRMLLDVKGRFCPVRIEAKDATFKLCKVQRKCMAPTKVPFIITHDGRTIRFPHPEIKKYDTIKVLALFNNYSTTSKPVRSMGSSSSSRATQSSLPVGTTWAESVFCSTSSATPAPLTSLTCATLAATLSPPGLPTFSSSARARSQSSTCPSSRVSDSATLKSASRDSRNEDASSPTLKLIMSLLFNINVVLLPS